MGETHLPFGVDQVVRGPVLVIEVAPDRVVVIDGYRVSDAELPHLIPDIADDAFKTVFRGVDADYHQAILLVLLRPVLHVRQGVLAIDAVVGPEIDEHHFASERLTGQCGRIEPFHRAGQRRHRALGVVEGGFGLGLAYQVLDDFGDALQHAFFQHADAFGRRPGQQRLVGTGRNHQRCGQDRKTGGAPQPTSDRNRGLQAID